MEHIVDFREWLWWRVWGLLVRVCNRVLAWVGTLWDTMWDDLLRCLDAALVGVHVNRVGGVPTVSVNDVFEVELFVFRKRIVRTKSVGIDGERLLVVVSQQEPDRRFVCGFRWHNVPLLGATLYENENGRFVLFTRSASASRETATSGRARGLWNRQRRRTHQSRVGHGDWVTARWALCRSARHAYESFWRWPRFRTVTAWDLW